MYWTGFCRTYPIQYGQYIWRVIKANEKECKVNGKKFPYFYIDFKVSIV